MATITGLTAERMITMENATVISGQVVGTSLILTTRGGQTINAGSVQGPIGPAGGAFVICTSTTRPTYTGVDQGKAIYETDTKLVRIWTGTRFRLQEKIVCTSTTRPVMVAADEGTKIYETDTDTEYTWTGTSWLLANSYVAKYADATIRASQWPAPPEGAVSYLTNSPGNLWIFQNGSWVTVGAPPGTAYPAITTVAPLNHVLMHGQTIANAQTLYPLLWSLADPTFKVGSGLFVPDMRSRIPVGKDDMGGVAANRITVPISGFNAVVLGNTGGHQAMQQHNHPITDPGHSHGTGQTLFGPGFIDVGPGSQGILSNTTSNPTGITVNNNGSGNAQNIQPSIILNWVLKVL